MQNAFIAHPERKSARHKKATQNSVEHNERINRLKID